MPPGTAVLPASSTLPWRYAPDYNTSTEVGRRFGINHLNASRWIRKASQTAEKSNEYPLSLKAHRLNGSRKKVDAF
jgi:hypothetical protein